MNFKIAKKNFLDELSIILKAVSNTTPLPILSGVKLSLTKSDLTLLSSDSNISIKTTIPTNSGILEIIEEGEIVVEARFLLEMVKRVDSEAVQIETIDGNYIKIYGAGTEYKVNSFSASDYPNLLFSIPQNSFKLKTQTLIDIVNETSFACSDKEIRPVLTGINFKAEGKILSVNATDSYRVAYKTVDLLDELNFNITIPCKYLIEVTRSLNNVDEVEIAVDNQQIFFLFNNTIIKTRLLDDIFPDTSKLIPNEFLYTLKINSRELLSQLDKTSIIKGDGKSTVRLNINKILINISSFDENGSFSGKMNVVFFDGDEFEISCSYKFLQEAVKAIGSDVTTICFSGVLKPFIIKDDNNPNLLQLVSPVRTYK